MSYTSEIKGGRAPFPLLFKGRVGEGLRKRKSKSQLVIQKKLCIKRKLRSRGGPHSYREGGLKQSGQGTWFNNLCFVIYS
jgi:hypothetical protein